ALLSAHPPSECGQVCGRGWGSGGGSGAGVFQGLKCPASPSPIIRQIRQACAEPFEAFEECLRQNEAAVGNCAEHVRRFLQCAEQVQPPHPPTAVEAQSLPAS
uniref:Coiled-coil-helix-coiled-coil-helix domain containing 5 n=1 Tax=Sciurus vulgaris TaxID=55149 RepID=A0A8D2AX00_SCIVU